MGHRDQFAKTIFDEETEAATAGALAWEMGPEIGLHEIRADGLLHVRAQESLATLSAPWCFAREDEVLLEMKMQGDHIGPHRFYRALLRRQARELQRCEQTLQKDWVSPQGLWVIAAHVPGWLSGSDVLTLTKEAEGCYRLSPMFFDTLWIAANELPLHEALIPFLVARTHSALTEFARWVIDRRPLEWLERMLEVLPMSDAQLQEILKYIPPTDDAERLRKRQLFTRRLLELTPSVREEVLHQGRAEVLARLCHKRLGRSLTELESYALVQQLTKLGQDELSDRILELDVPALEELLRQDVPT